MTVDPAHAGDIRELHELLLGAVSPRPIAFASTIDIDGNVNLSPFSFFNVVSTRPPILVFSPNRRRDKTTKHTLDNILETREVVINTVSYDIVQQVSLASSDYGKGVNEFVKAGFTQVKSERVRPPRVKESPVSFECRVLEVKQLGSDGNSGNLVICEVLLIHISESILDEQRRIDPRKIDNVARLGRNYYCRVNGDNIFEVPKPVIPAGIGFDQLPPAIRNSTVLTGNDLGRLANIDKIPTREEVVAFSGSYHENLAVAGSDRQLAIHRKAQQLLSDGEIRNAWLLLLSSMENGNGTE